MAKALFLLLFLLLGNLSIHAQSTTSLDSSFATYGIYMGDSGAVAKMAVQPDGKIIIVCGEQKNGMQTMAMRFNGDGSIDSSFAENGRFYPSAALSNATIVSVCVQPDGKIIIAGTADTGMTRADFLLLRLKNDGTLDSSFGNGGYVLTSYNETSDTLASIALQPDGKLIAYGRFNDGQDTLQIMRYHIDGSPDSSFGMNGQVKLYEGFTDAVPNDIAVMSDGRIVAGGKARINAFNGAAAFTAIRMLPDGRLDTSFNHTGVAYSDLNLTSPGLLPSHYNCTAMSVQADGKILLAGHVYVYDPNTVFGPSYDTAIVVRFDSLGKPDNSFGNNGFAGLIFRINEVTDMVLQPDGKIVIATHFIPNIFPASASYFIFRLMPDGRTDSSLYSWGYWGIMISGQFGWSSPHSKVESILLQQDGKLLAGGHYHYDNDNNALYMARYETTTATSVSSPALSQQYDITVYPNPATDHIYIDHPETQTIRQLSLYSLDGKRLLTKTYPYTHQLSTEGFTNGIYYLKLSLDNYQQITKKIIIQKN